MCSRATLQCLAGRMWPAGRTLPRPGLKCTPKPGLKCTVNSQAKSECGKKCSTIEPRANDKRRVRVCVKVRERENFRQFRAVPLLSLTFLESS